MRPSTATRGRARSPHAGDPQLPRRGRHHRRSASRLAILAVLFDRLGRYEPAATIAGFAAQSLAAAAVPEITTAIAHLRDVLGEATYESLARKGETMTTAAMATYAYDQIDQARTELERRLEIDHIRDNADQLLGPAFSEVELSRKFVSE